MGGRIALEDIDLALRQAGAEMVEAPAVAEPELHARCPGSPAISVTAQSRQARCASSRRMALSRRVRLCGAAARFRRLDRQAARPCQPAASDDKRLPAKLTDGLTMPFRTLEDAGDLKGKRVLLRVDLNVPVKDGAVTDATRIERVAPTIRALSDKGAKVALLAHFERPKGKRVPEMSLDADRGGGRRCGRPAGRLRRRLHRAGGGGGGGKARRRRHRAPGEHPLPQGRGGQRSGVRRSSSPRSATSTSTTPSPPRIARMPRPRGSRIFCRPMPGSRCRRSWRRSRRRSGIRSIPSSRSSAAPRSRRSWSCSRNLIRKVDALVIGGGMANTFLAAKGVEIGKSLNEPDLQKTAKQIMQEAAERGLRDRASDRRRRGGGIRGERAAQDRRRRRGARRHA